ncbi:glycyl-radical enzyme activating protein [Ruminococcaceae bacterium OttesenSCG-928-L11]|nr:glycyl-radical enzyme activating protein [Ruminococcaceae bacterium OttesenSCG-928-L11]
MEAHINNIQRFSIHDGPGIRTTVFFQGCNLQCQWCHNPDTIPAAPVFRFQDHRCLGCGACVHSCPAGALQWKERPFWRGDLCTRCGSCQAACPAEACSLSSTAMALDAVVETVRRDKPFYDASGGGMTCSGGEPMLTLDFLYTLLSRAKALGIHTAVDTAANIPWEHYARIIPVTDLFLVDYKAEGEAVHRSATGGGNRRIRDNLRRFADCGVPVTIRIPVIPGVNANGTEITTMAEHLWDIRFAGTVELLKLHHWGEAKYKALGRTYPLAGVEPPGDGEMEQFRDIMLGRHLNAVIG